MVTLMEIGQSKPYKNRMEICSPYSCLSKFGQRVGAAQKSISTFLWTLATLLAGVSDFLRLITTNQSVSSPHAPNFNWQLIWKEEAC